MKRSIFDYSNIKEIEIINLNFEGKHAGKIIARRGKTGACTAQLFIYSGPLATDGRTMGHAGGSGYCRFSGAVDSALRGSGFETPDLHGAGKSAVISFLTSKGYEATEIL